MNVKKYKPVFMGLVAILTIIIIYWFFSVIIIDRSNYSRIKQGMIEANTNFRRINKERANYSTICGEFC